MRVEPVSWDVLVDRIIERIVDRVVDPGDDRCRDGVLRVLVDGHPSTEPERLADALVAPLRVAGRPAGRVHVADFWRPASLRLEHGHEDADALLDEWIDVGALNREVLTAVGHGGTGRYLPSLRDPATSRSTRADYVEAPPGTVLLLDGSLTLGRGLETDLTVHLALRADTLARRTPPEEAWTLAAYARYRAEVAPEAVADVVARVDDPRHPALVLGRATS